MPELAWKKCKQTAFYHSLYFNFLEESTKESKCLEGEEPSPIGACLCETFESIVSSNGFTVVTKMFRIQIVT